MTFWREPSSMTRTGGSGVRTIFLTPSTGLSKSLEEVEEGRWRSDPLHLLLWGICRLWQASMLKLLRILTADVLKASRHASILPSESWGIGGSTFVKLTQNSPIARKKLYVS